MRVTFEVDSTLADVRLALTALDALNNTLVARGIEKSAAALDEEKQRKVSPSAPVVNGGNGHDKPEQKAKPVEEPQAEDDDELDYQPYEREVMKNCAEAPHPAAKELAELLGYRGRKVTAEVKRRQYELTKEILGAESKDEPTEEVTASSLPEVLAPQVEAPAEPNPGPVLPAFLTVRPVMAPPAKSQAEALADLESYARVMSDEKGAPTALAWWTNAVKGRDKPDHTQLTVEDIDYILTNPNEFMPAA